MRYIVVDERALGLADLRRAFAAEEEDYTVDGTNSEAEVGLDGRTIARVATNRRGLLQADGEGYYDADGLILGLE